MYPELPLWAASLLIVGGLLALAWSSDKFVLGAASLARNLGVSPFIVGMVIVGFGTSAPELLVSMFSGLSGHTNLSLGNAYGSCIFNIAGILGVAALVRPIAVKRQIRTIAVPLLLAVCGVSLFLLRDNALSRTNALTLLGIFAVVMPLYCKADKSDNDSGDGATISTALAAVWTLVGLVTMVGASHVLVWGSVAVAQSFGVSDLMIGLTIVAIGTSIPELASAVAAARRGEPELVLGNIVGSNLFNTLAVVGIAGAISPSGGFSRYVMMRDLPVLTLMTMTIWFFGRANKNSDGKGRISRIEGLVWLLAFIAYTCVMIYQEKSLAGA